MNVSIRRIETFLFRAEVSEAVNTRHSNQGYLWKTGIVRTIEKYRICR